MVAYRFVKRSVEKLMSRRQNNYVSADGRDIRGSTLQFPHIVFDVLENIDVKNAIELLLRCERR